MSGGGGQTVVQPSTSTTVQDIPAWEQGYVTNLLGQAQTEAAQPYQQYPGQQIADFTPDQMQAFSNIEGAGNTNAAYQNAAFNTANTGANTANNIYGAGAGLLNASTMAASPLGIQSYMSPYTNDVVQGLQNEANLNWNQNIMPGINNEFIHAGQGLSGRNAQVLGQAAGNFQTGLSSNIANALQSGYSTAGQQAATEAGILGSAGTGLGNLAATQAGTQLSAGTQLGALGAQQANTNLNQNQALQAVGQQQQQLNQANLQTAQQNWQNQVSWPEQQTEFLNQIIRGLPAPSATTTAGQSPANTVSPLAGIGGSSLSVAGLSGLLGKKEGGLIKGYAEGGTVTGDDTEDTTSSSPSNPLSNVTGAQATPPSASGLSQTQLQNMQMLALARGLLTPQPLGQSWGALGQGIGNAEDVGMEALKFNAQQNALNWQRQQEQQKIDLDKKREAAEEPLKSAQTNYFNSGAGAGNRAVSVIDPQTGQPILMPAKQAISSGATPTAGLNQTTTTLTKDALEKAADALHNGATLTQVIGGMGGQANRTAVMNRYAEKYPDDNLTQQQTMLIGERAGARSIGTQGGRTEYASESLSSMIPLAKQASDNLDRTQYPSINAIQNAVERGTGDTNIVALNTYLNAVMADQANLFVRGGASTDAARAKAEQMANAALSKGQLNTYFDSVQNEINAQRQAYKGAMSTVSGNSTPNQKPTASATPPSSAQSPISKTIGGVNYYQHSDGKWYDRP